MVVPLSLLPAAVVTLFMARLFGQTRSQLFAAHLEQYLRERLEL